MSNVQIICLLAWLAVPFVGWIYFFRWDNRIYLKAYTKRMDQGEYLSHSRYWYKDGLEDFPELRSERKRMNNLSLALGVLWIAVWMIIVTS